MNKGDVTTMLRRLGLMHAVDQVRQLVCHSTNDRFLGHARCGQAITERAHAPGVSSYKLPFDDSRAPGVSPYKLPFGDSRGPALLQNADLIAE